MRGAQRDLADDGVLTVAEGSAGGIVSGRAFGMDEQASNYGQQSNNIKY